MSLISCGSLEYNILYSPPVKGTDHNLSCQVGIVWGTLDHTKRIENSQVSNSDIAFRMHKFPWSLWLASRGEYKHLKGLSDIWREKDIIECCKQAHTDLRGKIRRLPSLQFCTFQLISQACWEQLGPIIGHDDPAGNLRLSYTQLTGGPR